VRSVLVAARGKGVTKAARRARVIATRYGVGPERMGNRIEQMVQLLDAFGCHPTLPITASVAERNRAIVESYAARGVEFAIHGYHHVDHTELSADDLRRDLDLAQGVLRSSGMATPGFRAPYLRADAKTLAAISDAGFGFDSSQAMHWPLDDVAQPASYRRALDFYGSLSAHDHPVLPTLHDGLVRIPYCLPDDEAVVDRLRLGRGEISRLWLRMFETVYERGELLTLGVHPERIEVCDQAIADVLAAARAKRPHVWVARLAEIARWWRDRTAAAISIEDRGGGFFHVRVAGPRGLVMFTQCREAPLAQAWSCGSGCADAGGFGVVSGRRPTIGVHPSSHRSVTSLLKHEGYVVERAPRAGTHSHFIHDEQFRASDRAHLLAGVDSAATPLLRLARWPDNARAALAVTGDIDALTIGDYARRLHGRAA
jgi:peptidoglycan/xylan/chitin deacetylase (PgdA/CDA1 family)